MSDEMLDEMRLRRALRLGPGESVRLDARALAAAAAAAEQASLVRWILVGLAACLVLPALTAAGVALAVVREPALALDPLALATLASAPVVEWLRALAQPATALAVVAGVAVYTAFTGMEGTRAHTTRT